MTDVARAHEVALAMAKLAGFVCPRIETCPSCKRAYVEENARDFVWAELRCRKCLMPDIMTSVLWFYLDTMSQT